MEHDNVDRTWGRGWDQSRAHDASSAQPQVRRKRAPVACRRCRRLRSKCVHQGAKPPCEPCRKAGNAVASTCVFLGRGGKDYDREYRHKRHSNHERNAQSAMRDALVQSDAGRAKESSQLYAVTGSPVLLTHTPHVTSPAQQDLWKVLPPFEEVFEGCRVFTVSCFQLGFIPKAFFLEKLSTDRESISVFLLYSILSVSARYTPCLIKRYGDVTKASEFFISRAGDLIPNEIYNPSLERIQAFFLLGISEWVQGDRIRSAMHMGIAVRMAGIYHLHREETYELPQNATSEDIMNSEVARRTFWCLETQDHQYTGHNAAVAFSLSDITTLLPYDESDFSFGIVPHQRAALAGTQIAVSNPSLCCIPGRSLFATLVEAHNLWGQVARRAGRASRSEREKADAVAKPWESMSDYAYLTKTLREWEDTVPARHKWSLWNLRGYKAESYDLAYLSVVMLTRLSNIIVRRIYLEDILESTFGTSTREGPLGEFWEQMAGELFENVDGLHKTLDTFSSLQKPDDGFPAILVFCIYVCGSLASYLWKWPQLCPQITDGAETILERSLEVLDALTDRLPLASRWLIALRKVAAPLQTQRDAVNIQPSGTLPHIEQINEQREVDRATMPGSAVDTARPGSQHSVGADALSSNQGPLESLTSTAINNDSLEMLSTFALHAGRNFSPNMPVDDEARNNFFANEDATGRKTTGGIAVDHVELGLGDGRGITPGVMADMDMYTGYCFDEDFIQLLQEDVRLGL